MQTLFPAEYRRTDVRPLESRAGARCAPLLLFLVLCSATARAELTLAEAERIAVERDAVTRQLAQESLAMRERAVAEGQLMDPRLRLGAVNLPVDSFSLDEEDMTMVELGVSQEFPAGDTRRLARQRMELSANAAEASARDRKLLVRRELRKVWTELAYLERADELLTAEEDWVQQMRQSARARYAAGEGQQVDLLRAGLEVAMLRERQLDIERDEAMQRAQLRRWLGDEAAARAGPFDLPGTGSLDPLAQLEAKLLAHPAQVDFEHRIEAAEAGAELARQRNRPGWMLDLSYGWRGGEMADGSPRSDMVTAMVSMDLPIFRSNRQDREVSAARAEARGLHEMHEDHLREMNAMLAEAWAVADRTLELERFYEKELLPLAEQSVQAAIIGWSSGRAMIDEVIKARETALETRMNHLGLTRERARAQYEIDYLTGEQP